MEISYKERRNRLLAALVPQSVVLLRANFCHRRNGDVHYSYRQQSDFYYLSGFNEAQAVMVLIPGRAEGEFILFNRKNDPIQEQWSGACAGQMGAKTQYGADESYPISQLKEMLPELLKNKKSIYYLLDDRKLERRIHKANLFLKKQIRAGVSAPSNYQDLSMLLHEMRLIKDKTEIDLMRKAASISAKAHCVAMQQCKPGMREYQLAAIIEREFAYEGCKAVAYPSIVAGGANACVLHYTDNNAELKTNELVLVDAGGEYQNYASDITRTYPVNGKFTPEQRTIYELVLKVQEKVIAGIRPGVKRNIMQELSEQLITEGLVELGILKGEIGQLLDVRAFKSFYMHGIGHWLGLDVHDAGAYKIQNEWRELKAGMVLTVEPGIYISPKTTGVDPRWLGIGVRIEDDILVTANGHEVLSHEVPKTVDEIEKLMSNSLD